MLLALILSLSVRAADGVYPMADLGGTVTLPKGWESMSWADWELKAKSPDGVLLHVFVTPYQVEVNEEHVKAWADSYVQTLPNEGFSDVTVSSTGVTEVAGRKTGIVRLGLTVPKVGKAVSTSMIFEGRGQVIHARMVTLPKNAAKGEKALEAILTNMTLEKTPAETTAAVSAAAGFAATLPEGWRAPLEEELPAVAKVAAKVGVAELDPARCWTGIRPAPVGEPDLMVTCKTQYYLPPLDSYSFADVEKEVHQRYFAKAQSPVPAGEPATLPDRVGVLYKVPSPKAPVRLLVAPYDGGMMVTWALGSRIDEAGLDAAIQATLPTVKFTGPNGGAPLIAADKRLAYYMKYRSTSPLVLGPVLGLLGLVGGAVVLVRKKASGTTA